MILLEVREYIKLRQSVNLQELSLHFQCNPDAMRDILGHWLRKGIVFQASQPVGCGVRCIQCKPGTAEVYCYAAAFDE